MKWLLVFLCWTSAALAQAPNATPAAAPTPLDPLLTAPSVWEAPQFVESNGALGFHWLSAAKDSAQSTLKTATLFGQPICQTLVRFDQGKPKEITALFYNRGDMGEIMRIRYEKLLQDLVAAISAATKTAFIPRGRDATNAVKVDGVTWNTPASTYLLEYSCTKTPQIPFRAEFVRLRITPVEKPKGLLERSFAESKKEVFSGPKHVFHNEATGDVFIKDIPMIDQGQKGYCVVASSARVLRYYGIQVDENELAQLANTDAIAGTNFRVMTESLKKLAARFTIHVQTIYETNYRALMADYDQIARSAKANPINPHGQDVSGIYAQMKPEILREARIKNRSGLSAFQRHVKEHVDIGIPVLWSVIRGMIPEGSEATPPPHGHMRLIIGYNEKTDEILYSDSWGIRHALKRMPTADAWVITTTMSSVEPL